MNDTVDEILEGLLKTLEAEGVSRDSLSPLTLAVFRMALTTLYNEGRLSGLKMMQR